MKVGDYGYLHTTMSVARLVGLAIGAGLISRYERMEVLTKIALVPFCGYNMADYYRHWLEMGKKIPKPPKIFHVNWFRKGADGKFLWPGYGENVRVLKWILERVEGRGAAQETPIGYVPAKSGLTLDGLKISEEEVNDLLRVDTEDWEMELEDSKQFFGKFGERLPRQIREEHEKLARRFQRVVTA